MKVPMITLVVILILVIVYFTINFANTGIDLVDYQVRSLYHANLMHLVANVISFLSLSYLETMLGSLQYLIAIVFVLVVSNLLLFVLHLVVPSLKRYTVGFSGVVFGLAVIYAFAASNDFKRAILPIIISLLPQIFISNISIEGHACGIIAGVLYVMIFRGMIRSSVSKNVGNGNTSINNPFANNVFGNSTANPAMAQSRVIIN